MSSALENPRAARYFRHNMKNADVNQADTDILEGLLQPPDRRIFFSWYTSGVEPLSADPDREWRSRNSETHPFREVLVILKGELNFQLASHVYAGRAGDVVMIDAFERHDNLYPPSVGDCKLLWMFCYPQHVSCAVSHASPGGSDWLIRCDYTDREISSHLNRAWNIAASGRMPARAAALEIGGLLDVIMAHLAGLIMSPRRDDLIYRGVRSRQYLAVMSALSYVADHLRENPGFEKLAERAGYSVPHFARLFRRHSGYAYREYLDAMRVQLYRSLRAAGRLSQKEIAAELGFSSASALIHWRDNMTRKHIDG